MNETCEHRSTLVFHIERSESDGGPDIPRRMYINTLKDGQISEIPGVYYWGIRDTGSRIAFVNRQDVNSDEKARRLLNTLDVDALVSADGINFRKPLVIDHELCGSDGLSIGYGDPIDGERTRPNQSMESLTIVSGGIDYSGLVHAGFVPGEKAVIRLGTRPDGKAMKLVFDDCRQSAPIGLPPQSRK